jgi:hypothetical protein
MSTMFSSCVSIDESRRPVACTTVLRPTSTERSCVTDTVSCAWNGYGKRHWKPASGVAVLAEGGDHRLLAFLHDEEAAAQPDQRATPAIRPAPMPALFMSGWKDGPPGPPPAPPAPAGRRRRPCRRTGR